MRLRERVDAEVARAEAEDDDATTWKTVAEVWPAEDGDLSIAQGRRIAALVEATRWRILAAEALLAAEWAGWEDWVGDGGFSVCPCCDGPKPFDADDQYSDARKCGRPPGHKADCALAVALVRLA